MSKNVKRLYENFRPSHYDLHLTPSSASMSFAGVVTIKGRKTKPSQRITLHQDGLKITKATITKVDKKSSTVYEITRINTQDSQQEVRIHTQEILYPGEYSITLEYVGKITKTMNGLYPCYFTEGDKEKTLLATQFESHHSREVFPGIDEPEAKATFDLKLTTPKHETVIANTPPKEKVDTDKDHVTTTFETTPIMSTYLLAFVVGEMEYRQAVTKDGVIVRTYATPQNAAHTDFALDVAVRALEFYNDYFGIPYPLAKCDMIALPDFASGAMENWGAITYRESCMLVDPDNTSLHSKQYVAMVVCHELAHQWFGNLVTMEWWTDLWLNEGFASWIEYLAVDKLFPDWHMWTQFIGDEQEAALRLDALEHTHPVEVPVPHPDEIRSIFDTISYNKGASVIHMLHEYLGASDFRKGLTHYLKRHAYANASTVDLWTALQEISGKPVQSFMHAWTTHPGFPIVHASLKGQELHVSQERFFLNPEVREHAKHTYWPIPLGLSSGDHVVLDKAKASTTPAKTVQPLKLNTGHSGFYRIAYSTDLSTALAEAVRNKKLTPLDRRGLLGDSFEAAKAGYTPTIDAIKLLASYEDEDNAAVWGTIVGGIADIRRVMDDADLRQAMKPFILELSAKQLKRLGWKEKAGEDHFDTLLRPTILGLNAGADHPEVVEEALRQFNKAKSPTDIHPDVRGLIYDTAVRRGDEQVFDKLIEWYKTTDSADERVTLAAAIVFFKQPELIKAALAMIQTPHVRLQDIGYWVAYSFMNYHGKQQTWEWMTHHWDWLKSNLENDLSFHRFPNYSARSSSDREFLKDYKAFFAARNTPALNRSIKQGIETITWQAAWRERDIKDTKRFFDEYNKQATNLSKNQ